MVLCGCAVGVVPGLCVAVSNVGNQHVGKPLATTDQQTFPHSLGLSLCSTAACGLVRYKATAIILTARVSTARLWLGLHVYSRGFWWLGDLGVDRVAVGLIPGWSAPSSTSPLSCGRHAALWHGRDHQNSGRSGGGCCRSTGGPGTLPRRGQ